MQPLTIVHLVHNFLPRHRHGVELSCWELARAQAAAGHRAVIIAGESGRETRELSFRRDSFGGFEVWRVHFHPRRTNGFLSHPALAKRFGDLLAAVRPDLVHVQHLANLSLSLVHAARDIGLPVVMTLHDYSLVCARKHLLRGGGATCFESDLAGDCLRCLRESLPLPGWSKPAALGYMAAAALTRPRNLGLVASRAAGRVLGVKPPLSLGSEEEFHLRNRAVREALGRVNRLLAPSEDLARRFERFAGLEEGSVQTVPQAVELNGFTARVREPASPPLRLGYVGKIAWLKGLHVLLGALRRLPPGTATLEVFGSPTMTALEDVAYYLHARRLARGLEVRFHPRGFAREERPAVYDRFDLLVQPSVCLESFGRVVVEAFAAGVPVVCSGMGGPAELVRDGVDGVHFPTGDEEALAAYSGTVLRGRTFPLMRATSPG